MFAVHGDLAHVKVVYDRQTGKSMGYGFVKFTTDEAAAAATAAINGMAIERKRIKVRGEERERRTGEGRGLGQAGADGPKSNAKNIRLFLDNLPCDFSCFFLWHSSGRSRVGCTPFPRQSWVNINTRKGEPFECCVSGNTRRVQVPALVGGCLLSFRPKKHHPQMPAHQLLKCVE